MQSDEDNINFSANDLSIEDLKQNLKDSNLDLFYNLKNRFTQDLLANMIFFVFNEVCKNRDQNSSEFSDKNNEPFAKAFFSTWHNHTKKQSKKELLEINNQLKSEKMNFLSAISNFSLPTTEDYQLIYNKALSDIQKTFEKNTTIE
jgi:hypothetical protein